MIFKIDYINAHAMLVRFALEYSDILHAYVLPYLRGMDILALSRACSQMQPLRLHPAAAHVRALAPSLRVIRVPYVVKRDYDYHFSRSSYKIFADLHVSIRGNVTYKYYRARKYFHVNYTAIRRYAHGNLTRIDMDESNHLGNCIVDIYTTDVDISDMWAFHTVTFESISGYMLRVCWHLNERDTRALMATCRSVHNSLRFNSMESVD